MAIAGAVKTTFFALLWSIIISAISAQSSDIEPQSHEIVEKKITEVVVEEQPLMILGELELRRLEPYFAKQAWNWRQLYDVQCTRNPHPGSCTRSLTRWFFYPTFAKCYAFLYGGCGGTANRFPSERECLRRCVPRQRPMRPPPAPDEPTLAPPPETGALNALLAQHDNETEAEVQRLAEPVTAPETTHANTAAPAPIVSSAPPATAPTTAESTAKPKSKRENPAEAGYAEELNFGQDVYHLDRIILR
ncbi:Papilin [Amphibalanus amphitrite]|uniref:Papilin n=1 Tax=Amphibalanus amphitrite TaxID=1232801 RepID=A0A6A4XH47_AMPAM|nr:Papilin [Amphibalanus amphitrite]